LKTELQNSYFAQIVIKKGDFKEVGVGYLQSTHSLFLFAGKRLLLRESAAILESWRLQLTNDA
jgi:hypothetical protein